MSISGPLQLNCANSSVEDFGRRLFGNLYSEASAYAVIDPSGSIVELKLFDTSFAHEVLAREWPEGSRVIVYSNHPEGSMCPSKADLRNLEAVPSASLCIVCEDECVMVR